VTSYLPIIWRWYPDAWFRDMTRPDMYIISGYEGQPLDLKALQYLPSERLSVETGQIGRVASAALGDYESILPSPIFTLDLLDAIV
jgi:hypothetical protein